jgi:hypothetical protein
MMRLQSVDFIGFFLPLPEEERTRKRVTETTGIRANYRTRGV